MNDDPLKLEKLSVLIRQYVMAILAEEEIKSDPFPLRRLSPVAKKNEVNDLAKEIDRREREYEYCGARAGGGRGIAE